MKQGVKNILAQSAIVKDHAEEKCFVCMFILLCGPLLLIFCFVCLQQKWETRKLKGYFQDQQQMMHKMNVEKQNTVSRKTYTGKGMEYVENQEGKWRAISQKRYMKYNMEGYYIRQILKIIGEMKTNTKKKSHTS